MRTLKESILDSIYENNLIDSLKIKIENSLKGGFLAIIDNETYNEIINTCEEVQSDDKKGTLWKHILPDIVNGASFKPIMLSLKNCTYRTPTDKEAYSNPSFSAFDKIVKKTVNLYKKYKISKNCIVRRNYNWLIYFLYNFKQVKPTTGQDWITIYINNVGNKVFGTVSFNYNTKEWFCGPTTDISSYYLNKINTLDNSLSYTDACSGILEALQNGGEIRYKYTYEAIRNIIKRGNVSDFEKNKKMWTKIDVKDRSSNINKFIYINTQTFEVLYEEDFKNTKSGQIMAANAIEQELEKIKNQKFATISSELNKYIHKNFTAVDDNAVIGRNWIQVREKGADYKYGRYMVSVETKEYRNQTFSEFYGSGIVD